MGVFVLPRRILELASAVLSLPTINTIAGGEWLALALRKESENWSLCNFHFHGKTRLAREELGVEGGSFVCVCRGGGI